MRRATARLLAAGLLGLTLTGAACAPTPQPPPQIDFSQAKPILLTVSQVELLDAYQPAPGAAEAEAEIAVSPSDEVTKWAQARLKAAGGPGVATITIREASVTSTRLKTQGGLGGAFHDDKDQTLAVKIVAELSISGGMGGGNATASVTVQRQISFPESYTLAERRNDTSKMMERLMADFDNQMEQGVRSNLAQYTTY